MSPSASEDRILTALGGFVLGAALLRAAFGYGQSLLVARLEQRVIHGLRERLHRHLVALRPEALTDTTSGELGSRVAYEAANVRILLSVGVAGTLRSLALATGLAGLAVTLDPGLATLGLLGIPLVGGVTVWLARRARRAQYAAWDADARLGATATEHARSVAVLRAFAAEEVAQARFAAHAEEAQRTAMVAARLEAVLGPAVQVTAAVFAVGVVAVAVAADLTETTPPGTLVSLAVTLTLLYGPVRGLASGALALASGLSVLDRLADLESLPIVAPRSEGVPLPPMTESLRLVGVHVAYGDGREPVLRGLDLAIQRGESVAVVGASGAGKTTLLRVLAGELAPDEGQVLLDGVPLGAARDADVRAQFGWVPQVPVLLTDTVTANVALGDPHPDAARVRRALIAAGAAAWVDALPEGAATILSEDGQNLSVGQRQRLCIARALYRDAPVLLLDEPTSALDPEAERALSDTLAELLAADRTVILVSHRESTVRYADRMIVLAEGRVAADGSPRELCDRAGGVPVAAASA